MKKELLGQALIKFASGVALVTLLTFLPAGTFSFWQAWLLCGVLFIPMLAAGS